MIDGILLLDKPVGMSSATASRRVQRILGARKAGHVGSLDPLASGMLPVCLGEATKLAGEILEGHKVYLFTLQLGERTATGDREGAVVERAAVPALQRERVESVLESFLGESEQIPPMYSAIKQQGQPLYKLARAGVDVERAPRRIWIGRLEAVGLEGVGLEGVGLEGTGGALELRVECGKGTYVRVLAEDIARALGTVGHVSLLRRESVQPFPPERMVGFEALEALKLSAGPLPLLGMDEAVAHLPLRKLTAEQARRICQGQALRLAPLEGEGGHTVRLHDPDGRFLGLGRYAAPGMLLAKRLVAQNPSE